ncbi:MAG: amidohydrolase family protein, partial [Chloroflexi bacterium]|nr:amidohydrolase family protein [Chloroflexota bacterium]
MTTAIRCGSLLDGTGADPIRGATIICDGNTITDIKSNGEVPRDAEVIDAEHLTIMPGMIDCHVHLGSSTWGVQERLLTPFSLIVAHALNHARITLEAGFTSVRDAAGTPRGVKMALDQGLFPGPRVRIAVSALSQTGGHGDSVMPNGASIRPVSELPNTVVDGVEGVRRAAREVLRAGADQIKVHTSGGVM